MHKNKCIFDCAVIGDIFIDINVRVDIGKIIHGGITECHEFIITPAGISNIAVALSILGCRTALIGKCGLDIFGDIFIKDIKRYKKITPYIFRDNSFTGILISLVDSSSAERSFITARGANNNLNISEIDKIFSNIQYRYLYTTGYSLVHSQQAESILYAMKVAKRMSATTIFDLGAYNIIKNNHDHFYKALRLTDILSCNLEEAKVLTTTNDLEKMILELSEIVQKVIIRLGEMGCVIYDGKDVRYIQAEKVKAIDTTGAGDAFTSALIYGLSNGWDLYKASYFANLFAANKITKMGARSFSSKQEIREMIKKINIIL